MSTTTDLVKLTSKGLYCEQANVYIDPWKKVSYALITHGHSDHARWGHKHYLCSSNTVNILKHRLGLNISVEGVDYGRVVHIQGVNFSFHPAGHVAGSSQIKVEYKGEVCVVTGDYKIEPDGITEDFELVRCNTIITECTFGLPVYRWQKQSLVMEQIHQWWENNANDGKLSVLTAYSLGKAQRLINALDQTLGPVYCHPSIHAMNQVYVDSGFSLPETRVLLPKTGKKDISRAVLLVPPAANGAKVVEKLGPSSTAAASGWMAIRGHRRRRGTDRGFVVSDHCDWPGLNEVIESCGASRVLTTHGYTDTYARWWREKGLDAWPLKTPLGTDSTVDIDH